MHTFSILGVLGIGIPAVTCISHQMQYYCSSKHNHCYAPDKNISENDISQPQKSYTGEQTRFMQAVSSHVYGGVSHPNFKFSS